LGRKEAFSVYKSLLCWRYLRHRYIALASVISVMLGVATMIVVNSVMAGFSAKMRERLHGVLADVIVESYDLNGFRNHDEVMARIREVAGDDVLAMAPTMETIGILKWNVNGQAITRNVLIIGIKPEDRSKTGDFAEFLYANEADANNKEKRVNMPASFEVTDKVRRNNALGGVLKDTPDDDPFKGMIEKQLKQDVPDEGAILGFALAHIHRDGKDIPIAPPGVRLKPCVRPARTAPVRPAARRW
jgi:lipoprotein-releasing system permease protein